LPSFTISTDKAQYGTASKRNEKEKNFFIMGMSLNGLSAMRVAVFIDLFFLKGSGGRKRFKMTNLGVGDKSFAVV
jgi:hypothetical protein